MSFEHPGNLPPSFESTPDGKVQIAFSALPEISMPEIDGLDPVVSLEGVRDVVRNAVHLQMRLGLRSHLVDGGSVLYDPVEDNLTDVYLTGDDDPEDAALWVVDKQSLDAQLDHLNEFYPTTNTDETWEDAIALLAVEAASAGLDLTPLGFEPK